MPLPNNTLRFPAPEIDFASDVGLSSQDHDNFPAAGAQPRWDWLLMWYISLLANQSGFDEPTQYRVGTDWHDLDVGGMRKYWNGTNWVSLSEAIQVGTISGTGTDAGNPITLQSWVNDTETLLAASSPESTFSGVSSQDGVTSIPIPDALLDSIDKDKNKAFVYINGLLVDPRNVTLCPPTIELINGIVIDKDDRFTVVIKNITDALFIEGTVVL
jgi:hypothetical protein